MNSWWTTGTINIKKKKKTERNELFLLFFLSLRLGITWKDGAHNKQTVTGRIQSLGRRVKRLKRLHNEGLKHSTPLCRNKGQICLPFVLKHLSKISFILYSLDAFLSMFNFFICGVFFKCYFFINNYSGWPASLNSVELLCGINKNRSRFPVLL